MYMFCILMVDSLTVLASGLKFTFLECLSLGLSNHVLLGGLVNRSVFLNNLVLNQVLKFKNTEPSSKIQNQVQKYITNVVSDEHLNPIWM